MKRILIIAFLLNSIICFCQEEIFVEEVEETIIESTESDNVNQYYQSNTSEIVTGEIDNTLLIFKGENSSLYGLKDKSNKTLVKPIFYSISTYGSTKDRIEAKLSYGKTGIIDGRGNIIIPFEYTDISKEQNIYKAHKDNNLIVFDYYGNLLLNKAYEEVHILNNSFRVKSNGLYGLIEFNGEEIFPISYEQISYYDKTDWYYVTKNGFSYFLNSNGEDVFGKKYSNLKKLDYNFDIILAEKKGKFGIINKLDQEIIPFIFDGIEAKNNDNLFIVKQNNKSGLYSPLFKKFLIEPKYDNITFLSDNFVILLEGNEKTLFNYLAHNRIDISSYDVVDSYISYDLINVTNNNLKGAIDARSGKLIVPFNYSYININSNYIKASLPNSRLIDLYNHEGNVLFEKISYFKDLEASRYQLVVSNSKYGVLNNSKVIAPAIYDEIKDYSKSGYILVKLEKKQGIINITNGDFLIPLNSNPITVQQEKNIIQLKNKKYLVSFNKLKEIK